MKFTVGEIAALLGAEVEGDATLEITGLAKIEEGRPGAISFFANPRYESHVYTTGASALIVSTDFVPKTPLSLTLIRTSDPYTAFTRLLSMASALLQDKKGIEQPSFISPTAELGEDVYVGAFAYIGHGARIGRGAKIYPHAYIGDQVTIGDGSTVYANVSIYLGCQVGAGCTIHSGAVIGSDGFGFAPQADGSFQKVPQTGIVRIEDQVEIGAGCTIDRATLGETLIRRGVKLDNLVHVAHNVEIGENTVIAAQTGISGSTRLGRNMMVGGQVGIVGHLQLADGTRIGAQSGVSKSTTQEGSALRGSPAQDYQRQLRSEAVFRNLDVLSKKIHLLEKKLNNSTT